MKFLISMLVFLMVFAGTGPVFAQEKKPLKPPAKNSKPQSVSPEIVRIIRQVANGAHMESLDAKTVSFTLRPNRAFITIEF